MMLPPLPTKSLLAATITAAMAMCGHASAQMLTDFATVQANTNINLNTTAIDYTYYFYPGEVVQAATTNFSTTLTGPGTGGYNSTRATATNSVTYTHGYVTNDVTGNTNPTTHMDLGSGDSDETGQNSLTFSPHGTALSSTVTLTAATESFQFYFRNYADGSNVKFSLLNPTTGTTTTLNDLADVLDGGGGTGTASNSVEGFVRLNITGGLANDVLTFSDTPVDSNSQYSSAGILLAEQVAAVPEPSTAVMGLGLFAVLGMLTLKKLRA